MIEFISKFWPSIKADLALIIGGLTLYYMRKIGKTQNKLLNYQIKCGKHQHFIENYNSITEGIGIIAINGRATPDAIALFAKASNQADLLLPIELKAYVKNIYNLGRKLLTAYSIMYGENGQVINSDTTKRADAVKEHDDTLGKILELDPRSIYSKYVNYDHIP